jgi:hypothetical protein
VALGFVALPWPFFVFLVVATATYVLLVGAAKRSAFHTRPD